MMAAVSHCASIERGFEMRLMCCVRRKRGQRSAIYAKSDGRINERILFFWKCGGMCKSHHTPLALSNNPRDVIRISGL